MILSLWSMLSVEPADSVAPKSYDPFSASLLGLVSLDPQERLRAAWLRSDFAVKGERFTIDGWRSEGLRYNLDGIPVWDMESGEAAMHLPGTLLAAASLENEPGDIRRVLELESRTYDSAWRAEASGLFPFFADSGHCGEALVFFSIPLGRKLCVGFDGEVVKWAERPESFTSLSRRGIAGYTGVVSAALVPSPGMLVQAKLLRSTEQRDLSSPAWSFNLSSAPSSSTLVDLLLFNYRYRKGVLELDMTLSSYMSALYYGGRGEGELSPFKSFPYLDSLGETAELDVRNPFGVKGLFYSPGSCTQLAVRNTLADRAGLKANVSLGEVHELRGSLDFTGTSIYAEVVSFYNGQEHTSSMQQSPRLGKFYLSDRMQWERFCVEAGMGVLYLEGDAADSLTDELPVSFALMPRVESHVLLEGFNIDALAELSAETPTLGLFYEGKDDAPWTDSLLIIPRINPSAERAFKLRFGANRWFGKHLLAGTEAFSALGYRLTEAGVNQSNDAADTIASAGVFMKGRSLAFGFMPWIAYRQSWLDVGFSYRFSCAQATTGGLDESYLALLEGDSAQDGMSRLPLDSRHKFVLRTRFQSPNEGSFLARGWFAAPSIALQSGFSDERGADGKVPWWAWCEIGAGRVIKLGPVTTELKAELLNPFGWTGPVIGELPPSVIPGEDDFPARVYLGHADYRSSRDINHDGVITAAEEVETYRTALRFYDAWTASPLPARSLELKLTVRF